MALGSSNLGALRGFLVGSSIVASSTACVSRWDLANDTALPIGCQEVTPFVDADGDGWGSEVERELDEPVCVATLPELTAANDLDCDDGDPEITGRVGDYCPGSLDDGGNVAGRILDLREFVAFREAASLMRYTAATERCTGWATERAELPVEGQRGLATLQDQAERALTDWLDDLSVGVGYAAFVDLSWSETEQDPSWRWPDGTAPEFFPFCNGEPAPEDFLGEDLPSDPDRDARLTEIRTNARLALVKRASDWCYGVPDFQDTPPDRAYAICERPAPSPTDYGPIAPDQGEP